MTTSPFLDARFSAQVTACSATPDYDGYVGTLSGMPYHIHPTATPDVWALMEDAIRDEIVTVTAWSAPVVSNAEALANLRAARNDLLGACDWTQMPDSPLAASKKAAWATYRQALRDLPDTHSDDPAAATFPKAPA